MYAVVQTGGKQYRVSPGDVIVANRLPGEDGETVVLSEVLMVDDGKSPQIGFPLVPKAQVRAIIIEQARDSKIIVFKKKRRQGYRRKHGHRQHITVLRVMEIEAGGVTVKAEPKKIVKHSLLIQAAAAARSAKGAKNPQVKEASQEKAKKETIAAKPTKPKAAAKTPATKSTK